MKRDLVPLNGTALYRGSKIQDTPLFTIVEIMLDDISKNW